MNRTMITLVVILTLVLAVAARPPQQGEDLFREALVKEQAEGDLSAAIETYRSILALPGVGRDLLARAQFRIGTCYEKLGRAEAIQAYQKVVSDYADQTDQVVAARTRLADLRAEEADPEGLSVHNITPSEGLFETFSESADGTRLLGVDYTQGQNIAVVERESGKRQLITNFDWAEETFYWSYFPIWSPDATRIAFMAATWDGARQEIRLRRPDGQTRTIYALEEGSKDRIRPCSWLADRSVVVAVLVSETDGTRKARIGLIPEAGGEFEDLRTAQNAPLTLNNRACPVASPDGRFLAYSVGDVGSRDIEIYSLSDGRRSTLVSHPADDHDPQWSPDGRHLAFLSLRHGSWALWALPLDDGLAEGLPSLIREGMQNTGLTSWTGAGLTYSRRTQIHDVHVVPIDPSTGRSTGAAALARYPSTGRNTRPVWSPDGRFLAFVERDAQHQSKLFVVVVGSDGESRRFPIPAGAGNPYVQDLCWLPDGSGLGFSRFSAQAEQSLYRLELSDGSWRHWLIPVKVWTRIEWNADGSGFYYARNGFGHEKPGIIERHLETGEEAYVYTPPGPESGSVFRGLEISDDRRFLSFEQDNRDLIVLDLQTGEAKVISSDRLYFATWLPDGTALLGVQRLTRGGDRIQRVMRIPLDGSQPTPIELGIKLPEEGSLGVLDLSSDGSRLAVEVRWSRNEVFQLRNPIPKD